MNYELHPAAEAELIDSVAYYEEKRAGLGVSFMTAFESALAKVCSAPHRFPIERKPDIQRIRLKRFPFTILYREVGGIVQVLAVAHKRRRPDYWQRRYSTRKQE